MRTDIAARQTSSIVAVSVFCDPSVDINVKLSEVGVKGGNSVPGSFQNSV